MTFFLHEQVLDNLPDGITIQDRNFNILYQNKTMKKVFGEHVGDQCFAIYEKRNEICEGCGVKKAFELGASVLVIRTAFEADGQTSYWENSCFPLFDTKGNITAGVEVCRNISDRVSLEEEVKDRNIKLGQFNKELKQKTKKLSLALQERQQAEENYHILFENALDAIFVADAETGILLDCNSAAQQMVHKNRSEIVGHSQKELHPLGTVNDSFSDHLSEKRGEVIETQVLTKEGEIREVVIKANIFEIKGRKVLQGVFHDITEKKKAENDKSLLEAQLKQSQKLEAIGQLAAGVAHEINTPAQYIGHNTDFLDKAFTSLMTLMAKYDQLVEICQSSSVPSRILDEIKTTAEEIDYEFLLEEIPNAIKQANDGVERVSKIVRSMKEFSHPPKNEKKPSDLNHAIENTITICRNEWKYVAEMVTEFDPNLPLVPCFLDEFNQVILNLIMNSIHAIRQKSCDNVQGKITVSTHYAAPWAEIRVRDTGTGIHEEHREKIFDPFFTTKEVGLGTGQGLAISHSIITKKHRGKIWFESEVGKGTVFIIQLPMSLN